MRLKSLIIVLLSIFYTYHSVAQSQGDLTQSRILILLDESSSMTQSWAGGVEKYKAADSLILRLMDSVYQVNSEVEFSLRVFGHQHTVEENNCTDTRNEVPFSKDNRTQMAFRLADIRPLGVTPIAYALEQAAEYDLVDEVRNAYSIILITDGGESCGGDICDVMQKLIKKKVYFKPYIVSLEDYAPLKTTYACMGDYLQVIKKSDISTAVSTIVAAFRPVLKITKADYKQLQNIAVNVPSILKINIPVNVSEPVDTQLVIPVKTFANNVIPKPVIITTPAPKVKKDTLTITPARVPPPARKIESIQAAPLRSFNTMPAAPEKAKLAGVLPLPTVVADTIVPHKVVAEAPRKIEGIQAAPLRSFNAIPAAPEKAKLVDVLPLPTVVADTIVARPAPRKIARIESATLRSFDAAPTAAQPAQLVGVIPALPAIVTDSVTPPKPRKIVVSEEAPRPAPRKIAPIAPAALRSFNVATIAPAPAGAIVAVPALPAIVTDSVAPPQKPKSKIIVTEAPPHAEGHKIASITPASLKPVSIAQTVPGRAKLVSITQPLPPVVADSVIEQRKIAKLKPAKLKTFNVLFIVEDRIFSPRKVPALPAVNYDAIAVKIDTKIPIPRKAPVPPGRKGNYTEEVEDNKQTSLAVYFTNGGGRFYTTTPQMIVVDPITKKVIKKFYRTIDASGEPDAQDGIPEGTYDIAVVGSRTLIIHDVEILKDKKKKLIITIKKGSLKFQYESMPGRPISEFTALVTERNVPNGKVVSQKCSEELMYEPGNYHIVINTFPPTVRNVDLDMEAESLVSLPQPGFAKFTVEGNARVAVLYLKDGDKYLPFNSLPLDDTASRHLRMQPGEYQAHFHKGPGNSPSGEKVVPFIIQATKETEVIIK